MKIRIPRKWKKSIKKNSFIKILDKESLKCVHLALNYAKNKKL